MKIGIFGGCFNPPHNMHKNIVERLITNGDLDKVIYVPTGDTYDKNGLIAHKNRLEMLNLIVDNVHTFVSDISKNEEYRYTYQVLDYYKEQYKDATLYFICGTDNLEYFYKWKEYEYILNNYNLIVVIRDNADVNRIMAKYEKYKSRIYLTNIRTGLLSSTMIREYIKKGNYDKLEGIMDKKVIQYVKELELYKM